MSSAGSAQSSGGGGGGKPDEGMGPVWLIALILVALFAAWHFGHQYIAAFISTVKLAEIRILEFFLGPRLGSSLAIIKTIPAKSITAQQLSSIVNDVNAYFRYPFAIILIGFASILFRKSPVSSFCRAHDMKSLLKQESVIWPQVLPVIGSGNNAEIPLNEGPWRMEITPKKFAHEHGLLKIEHVPTNEGSLADTEARVSVNVRKAEDIFCRQLGPPWQGVERLPLYYRVFYALFAARSSGKLDEVTEIVRELAFSAGYGRADFTRALQLLNGKFSDRITEISEKKHFYVTTVMQAVLEESRQQGVFPTADFLWLKPINHFLWILLNSVGRQTPFVSVAGCVAHYKAEKKFGKGIKSPMIGEAVKGLEKYFTEILF